MLSSMCELAHIPAGYDVLPQFPNACDGSSSGGMASERPCVSVGPSCSFARTATHAIYYRKKTRRSEAFGRAPCFQHHRSRRLSTEPAGFPCFEEGRGFGGCSDAGCCCPVGATGRMKRIPYLAEPSSRRR